ncbi:MAG: OmpA family protein [Bacteroidia bacterium]|nr:OmpA family protein [Bacteroidia bacterium]
MDDDKAVQLYKKGTDKKKVEKPQRMAYLKQALELEPDYADANFAYAEELVKTEDAGDEPFTPAVPFFLKVIQQCPKYHSEPYYYTGIGYLQDEKYTDAITYLQKFLNFKDDDAKKFSKNYDEELYVAKKLLNEAKFFDRMYNHPVAFDPYPVKDICTTHDEYLACISPDNRYAFFTRSLPYQDLNNVAAPDNSNKEYFMESQMQADGNYSVGTALPPPFNTGRNEGGPAITIDDKSLFFTICQSEAEGSYRNCDIYYTNYEKGRWTKIENLGQQVNDPGAWDSQPSVTADGTTLYFASDRTGGIGKSDIYKTIKDPKTGEWSPPINLGEPINTPGNEKSPFIHTDSHTLYFSSDYSAGKHLGLGGYDIFYSRADSAGNWKDPGNIGYPINSAGDDIGFFVSTDGKKGYFCSNDPNRTKGRSMGGYDIFQFDLYQEARPDKVALIAGKTTGPGGETVAGAQVTVTNTKTKKTATVITDTLNGTFVTAVDVSDSANYVLTVNKKGAVFNSTIISIKDTFTGKPSTVNMEVKPITVGANYTLNNIYYKSNSAELQAVSVTVIAEFSKFLKANPSVKIKIAGYTDNVGSEKDNLALSNDRAFTVKQALEHDGIQPARLTFEGFGAANPVASNDTEEGRQKNRRTEFVILEK